MTIDRSRYGSRGEVAPKLEASMFPGSKVVLTVMDVREIEGKYGNFLAIKMYEYPDHEYITNKTQEDALFAAVDAGMLSADDFYKWDGVRIPFIKRKNQNPETGKYIDKLYAMPPEDWEHELASFDAAVEANKRGGVKASDVKAGGKAKGGRRR